MRQPQEGPERWVVEEEPATWMAELGITDESLSEERRERQMAAERERAAFEQARHEEWVSKLFRVIDAALDAETPPPTGARRQRRRHQMFDEAYRRAQLGMCVWCGWNAPRSPNGALCQPCQMFRSRNGGQLPGEHTLAHRRDEELRRAR